MSEDNATGAPREATPPASTAGLTVDAQDGRCSALRTDGQPCQSPPGPEGRCAWHSDRYRDLRGVWARRGAAAAAYQREAKKAAKQADFDWSDASKIRTFLQQLGVRVMAGEIPPSVARTLKELALGALKVVDVETDLKIAEQLEPDA